MELCRSPKIGLGFTALRYFTPRLQRLPFPRAPGSCDRQLCALGRRGRHFEASLGRNDAAEQLTADQAGLIVIGEPTIERDSTRR